MSLSDGHAALIRRLVTMTTSASIVLPNGPGAPCPRYVVQEAGGSQRTRTLDGVTQAEPEILVLVETDTDYTTENAELVSALVDRFPVNLRTDGVTIREAPLPRPPLSQGSGVYTTPVFIRGFMSF